MAGILNTAARGLGDLLGMAGTGTSLAGKVIKGSFGVGEGAIGKAFAKNPVRLSASVLSLAGAAVSFGVAGIGPLGDIGQEYARYRTSEYGNTPTVQRSLAALRGVGIVGGIGLTAVGGAGLFGRGPLAVDYAEMATRKGQGIIDAVSGATKSVKSLGTRTPPLNPPSSMKTGRGAYKRAAKKAAAAKAAAAPGPKIGNMASDIGSGVADFGRWFKKRHGWQSFAVGVGAGMGAGVAASQAYFNNQYGYEGDIQGISSSPSGGISPELQFSNQGLVFALHRNNKSMRRRYQ